MEVSELYNKVDKWIDENTNDNEDVSFTLAQYASDGKSFVIEYRRISNKSHYEDRILFPFVLADKLSIETIYMILGDIITYCRDQY